MLLRNQRNIFLRRLGVTTSFARTTELTTFVTVGVMSRVYSWSFVLKVIDTLLGAVDVVVVPMVTLVVFGFFAVEVSAFWFALFLGAATFLAGFFFGVAFFAGAFFATCFFGACFFGVFFFSVMLDTLVQ